MYDRTLIQIRERSFFDLLDLTFLVLRKRPLVLGLYAGAGVLPCAALNQWLLSQPEFPRGLWVALLFLEVPWATAPLTVVLGELMFGQATTPLKVARRLLAGAPSLLLSQLLLRALLLVSMVGCALIPSQLAFQSEVILLERMRGFRALSRGRALTRGVEGELFMRWLGQLALGLIFALCFWMGAETIVTTLIGDELTWYRPGLSDLGGMLFQGAVWIAMAYFGVFRFLEYIDRRIRLEGWELELRLKAAGRALEARLQ
jgi:hypothetical protein